MYQIGDRVRLQNIVTKEFKLFGTITNLRLADDGAVVSYGIATDKGYNTTLNTTPKLQNKTTRKGMFQNQVHLAKLK